MPRALRRLIHRFVPSHFHDPIGLTRRLLRSGEPAARFAMESAVLGILATPLDLLLRAQERRLYRAAPSPSHPLVFVCGPARSGTTLVAQVLIDQLDVAFFNNLTAIFPRAPLTANRLFSPRRAGRGLYRSYYGRTTGFGGPNDALHIWDRWLGPDRTAVRASLPPETRIDLQRFFGAMQRQYRKPIVAKNNSLNAVAHLVAQALDHAVFLCLSRDPVYLAQSLLQARAQIHGSEEVPYGLQPPGRAVPLANPIESVCRQVLYHERLAEEQQRRLGSDRFWIVSYESFCADPSGLVETVSRRILRDPAPPPGDRLPAFTPSTAAKLPPERLQEISRTLVRLRQDPA